MGLTYRKWTKIRLHRPSTAVASPAVASSRARRSPPGRSGSAGSPPARRAAAAGPPASLAGMNVVMFLTDQERAIQHFPLGWAEQQPARPHPAPAARRDLRERVHQRVHVLARPLDADVRVLPGQHGVKYTLESDMQPPTYPQVPLPTPSTLANTATVMSAAGYNVDLQGQVALQQAGRRHLEPVGPDRVRLLALEPGRRRGQPEHPRDGRRHREQRRPLHDVGRRLPQRATRARSSSSPRARRPCSRSS